MEALYRIIYDDSCRLCRQGVKHLLKLDRMRRVSPVRLSDVEAGRVPRTALPPVEQLRAAIHLIAPDGTVFRGETAIAEVLDRAAGMRAMSWLLRLPGIRRLAGWVYGLVARNRSRLSRLIS